MTSDTKQKSLSSFFETEKEDDEKSIESKKESVSHKIDTVAKRKDQIETDYYSEDRIQVCAKKLRERFNVNVKILPVRYGNRPPLNEKIYGYYMLVTIKGGVKGIISDFIRKECKVKVY